MKKLLFLGVLLLGLTPVFAADTTPPPKTKLILLIAEQNIEGPQRAWWASEIDLSTTESVLAQRLLSQGYEVLEPSFLNKTISKEPAFRVLAIGDQDSVKLGKMAAADYIIVGKALATSGGNVPQSNMRSCFANITAKVIRVKDGKAIAYVDASGSSAHMDVITGGREALQRAAEDMAVKVVDALAKQV